MQTRNASIPTPVKVVNTVPAAPSVPSPAASGSDKTPAKTSPLLNLDTPLLTSTKLFEDLSSLGCFVGLANKTSSTQPRLNFRLDLLLGQRMKSTGGQDAQKPGAAQRKSSDKFTAQAMPEFANISTSYGKTAANISSRIS